MTTATVTNTYAQPTEKQAAYAESLSRKAGFKYLSGAEKACFGKCKVGGLNRQGLSELIDWLIEQAA